MGIHIFYEKASAFKRNALISQWVWLRETFLQENFEIIIYKMNLLL